MNLSHRLPSPDFHFLLDIDSKLVYAVAALASLGMVMLASSSIDFAAASYGEPWYFVKKQLIFMAMGIALAVLVAAVPMVLWQRYAVCLLLLSLLLLIIVLLPGVGKSVNGSQRWLPLGPFSMQASEIAKFGVVVFFASYLSRRLDAVRYGWLPFMIMVTTIALTAVLLLLEPDFGIAFVLGLTLCIMMFAAGVPILRFLLLTLLGMASFAALAVLSPYRWKRLVTFMDPWSQQFDSGYQLVQSLIAFGRGEWFGLGLGNSLQKLFFLPEAHTDFIFAIYAEEFGLVGAVLLIGLYGFFLFRVLINARLAANQQQHFAYFLLLGFACMMGIQSFINMGVASGLLPTKGLTLPFISYGGSSMLITYAIVALLLRASYEVRRGQ